jgi:hypothetical protein
MEEYLSYLSQAIIGESHFPSVFSDYTKVQDAFNSIDRPDIVKFVDIGCGLGLPLHIAKKTWGGNHDNGDIYHGIEIDSGIAAMCRKIHGGRIICDDFVNQVELIKQANIIYTYEPYTGFDSQWVIDNMTNGTIFIYIRKDRNITIY